MFIGVNGNILTCRFTRDNYNPYPNYKYPNGENLFVIVAYGKFSQDGIFKRKFYSKRK